MRPERRVLSVYDRLFDDPHQNTAEEPFVSEIHDLARSGLAGPHGEVAAMGVPRRELPSWDDLQILTAQLRRFPLLDDEPVDTDGDDRPGRRQAAAAARSRSSSPT